MSIKTFDLLHRLCLYLLPVLPLIYAFELVRFHLNFSKYDFGQFLLISLICSIGMGKLVADIVIMPIIEKLFQNQESTYAIEVSKNLTEKERNICRNSKKSFRKSLWLLPLFLTLTVAK